LHFFLILPLCSAKKKKKKKPQGKLCYLLSLPMIGQKEEKEKGKREGG